jgi:hypothetical protein
LWVEGIRDAINEYAIRELWLWKENSIGAHVGVGIGQTGPVRPVLVKKTDNYRLNSFLPNYQPNIFRTRLVCRIDY